MQGKMAYKRASEIIRALNGFLEQDLSKLGLSVLIIVSVLPESVLSLGISSSLSLVFFAIFSAEFAIRAAAFAPLARDGKAGRIDFALLALDLVATLSFLPLELIFPAAKGLKILRVFRLMRIFLLLRYWGPVGREIWFIVMKRRYQVLFAISVVVPMADKALSLLRISHSGTRSMTG